MLSKYDVAAIVATNDLEQEDYQKLSAAKQRELFGANVLGRRSVNFDSDGQGTVRIFQSAAFGTDGTVQSFSYEEFANICNNKSRA